MSDACLQIDCPACGEVTWRIITAEVDRIDGVDPAQEVAITLMAECSNEECLTLPPPMRFTVHNPVQGLAGKR